MNLLRNKKLAGKIRKQNAFTLVEMIVVLVIISLLMGFLLKGIWNSATGAKSKLTEMKMEKLKSAINQYQLMNNKIPPTLGALTGCDNSRGGACVPVADKDDLNDAWETPFQYQADGSGRSYKIKSYGADGKDGGAEMNADITLEGP
jgi:general secretion pathway protein G